MRRRGCTATDGRGVVAAVAIVVMLTLAGGRLADGLDGGGVLMIAAGFAHDESLLMDPAPARSLITEGESKPWC